MLYEAEWVRLVDGEERGRGGGGGKFHSKKLQTFFRSAFINLAE